MKVLAVEPGNVVVTDFGIYQHWSLVTDKFCEKGRNMLISATKRTGTVKEETWDVVTQGKKTYVASVSYTTPVSEVLHNARSKIDSWQYSVTDNNCEHFVKWASGLKVTSTQVKAGFGGVVAGIAVVGLVSENPKTWKLVGGALLVGGLAMYATRPKEKEPTV
jgi:hypothetical protein